MLFRLDSQSVVFLGGFLCEFPSVFKGNMRQTAARIFIDAGSKSTLHKKNVPVTYLQELWREPGC